MAFKPSKYQIFLTTIVIVTIVLLLNPNLIFPNKDKGTLRIGIIDSGCSVNQSPNVADYQTFTTIENGYSYSEKTVYDTLGHGSQVCDIIISGTNDVSIYSARIANSRGELTYSGLFAAINYLVNTAKVNIINLSLGGEPYLTSDLLSAFQGYASQVIFIAAVGNRANDFNQPEARVDWPSTLPWVIGVGAIDQAGNRTVYSSYGRDYQGLYTTEFSASGSTGSSEGTSFSAPRITVAYANLWQELQSKNIEVTPEILNFYLAKSTQGQFTEGTGWGLPQSSNFNVTGTGALIEGQNELDPYLRYADETWTMRWKVVSTMDDIQLQFTGNGTTMMSGSLLTDYSWGKILEVNFTASENPGIYDLTIGYPQGNSFTYSVNNTGKTPDYKILLDHRNTINGFAHPWGIYSNFAKYFRKLGVEVDQITIGTTNLTKYDSVIVTEFGKKIVEDRNFTKDFDSKLFQEYIDYTRDGGNLQVMTNFPSEFNQDGYSQALHRLGADIGSIKIPKSDANVIFVDNITKSSLFEGVQSIGASGSPVYPMNASQTVLVTYDAPATSIGDVPKSLPVCINSTLGAGSVFIWSGSGMIQNDYFRMVKDNYDQFLLNYLQIYSNN